MADFQNGLTSRIFGLFWSGFLHRTTVNDFQNRFGHFFGILIFALNWGFCMGYSLCMMAAFQNGLISPIVGVFSSVFFHRTIGNDL